MIQLGTITENQINLKIVYLPVKLVGAYHLSFGTIHSFDTFFVIASNEDRIGYGEITPLPGYSWESIATIKRAFEEIRREIKAGKTLNTVLNKLRKSDPFVVSGIVSAIETLHTHTTFLETSVTDLCVNLSAICEGNTKKDMANRAAALFKQGYQSIKVKVGKYSLEQELDRITGVSEVIEGKGEIRLDANQAYEYDTAMRLCERLESISGIALLEQPFKPHNWVETQKLTSNTSIPIMLDESIWSIEDVGNATECKAKWVKFKLCKHLGIQGSLDMIFKAKSEGLNIVYGNGVQTCLGNHLETEVYRRTGLKTAFEGNGFLKVSDSSFEHNLIVKDGQIVSNGTSQDFQFLRYGETIFDSKCELSNQN